MKRLLIAVLVLLLASPVFANESRGECERFYADYGGRMGGRAPLFYDLPECIAAFEFLQGNQNPDS